LCPAKFLKKVNFLAVACQIMTKKQPNEKPKAVPESPKVFHYFHHFDFLKSFDFYHFFSRNIFRLEISKKPQGSQKLNKARLS
jgi:hypothetical protein